MVAEIAYTFTLDSTRHSQIWTWTNPKTCFQAQDKFASAPGGRLCWPKCPTAAFMTSPCFCGLESRRLLGSWISWIAWLLKMAGLQTWCGQPLHTSTESEVPVTRHCEQVPDSKYTLFRGSQHRVYIGISFFHVPSSLAQMTHSHSKLCGSCLWLQRWASLLAASKASGAWNW